MLNNNFQNILIKFGLWLATFILIIIIGVSKVFAFDPSQYYVVSDVSNKLEQLVSTDYASSPFTNPINSGYAFGQVLEVSNIVNNFSFQANKVYQLEVHFSHQRITDSNIYSVTGLNGEQCLISYDNSIMNNDAYPRWAFQCPHATNTITVTISNSSGSYLWSGTNIFDWSSATVWASDTIQFETSDTDNIINNQNQNTQNIINNQNQNTQNIIDNQNSNTQQQIESQKVCESIFIDKDNIVLDKRYLNSNGSAIASNDWGVTDYIEIPQENSISIKVIQSYTSATSANLCWYNSSKTLISCSSITNLTGSLTIPSNSRYFRSSIYKSTNIPTYEIKTCKNGNQALNDSINDDDTSGATNEASDFFSGFSTNTFGLTSIITAPLNLIQSLTSSTCSELHLPLPYLNNKYLDLPCMTTIYQTHFGAFFTMYQTITYGIIAYWVCVRIFNQVKDFKNPEHDEIEVVDL